MVNARLAAIEERRDGNLVVFRGDSAFVGSGEELNYQHVLIDVSKGKLNEDGTTQEPEPFTSQDLHLALVDSIPKMGLDNVQAEERLFVNGRHIRNNRNLLGNPLTPPPTRVADDFLREAALHPTPDARAYVCVEIPGWQGQLVVTLFVRAVRTDKLLYIEWTFHVLPPLRRAFLVTDRFYQRSRLQQARETSVASLRETVPALLGSPFLVPAGVIQSLAARRHRARQAYRIERGCIFDYGASRSIREIACGDDQSHHFLTRDFIMYLLFAEEMLIRAIAKFLVDKKIDLAQYNSQTTTIINNTMNNTSTNIKTGDIINSKNVGVGRNIRVDSRGQKGGGHNPRSPGRKES